MSEENLQQTLDYSSKRYHQVKEIFQVALDKLPAEREAYLNEACADDPLLKQEVEELLAMNEEADDFIEAPAFRPPDDFITKKDEAVFEGRRLGNYQIIREIGHGGMGAVYLATRADDQYKKRVAIKLIRGGADNEFIRRRFLSERQILASLDHPNIAKLLDGGTTEEGIPYLVMDYIEGLPIDDYCDRNKLTTAERVRLFRTVCSAVHYAHQNLVIHRDLKPGNILVSQDGTPHLLDFGIAKLLNPALSNLTLDLTAGPMGPMTPEYASPEQVRGEPLTTSSDIYSLGVVLYELLTGHRPYQFQSRVPHVIAQVICEQEPEKPSTVINRIETNPYAIDTELSLTPESVSRTREGQPDKLRRRLQGDLDNIVLMAMRKEPQRRYASVEQLSEDLRRHLEGLPVIARKPTFSYRALKFVNRNKVGVAAAALVILAIIAGVVATLWQARIARLQKIRAEQRFNDVRQLANSFMFEIHDQIENLPGSTPARKLLVSKALNYLDSLAGESHDDATLQRELATAYQKVGDIQGNPYNANLGDPDGALDSYRKSLMIRERLFALAADDQAIGIELATSYHRVGDIYQMNHQLTEAKEQYQKAFEIAETLNKKAPDKPEILQLISSSLEQIGEATARGGNMEEGLASMKKALVISESLYAKDPDNWQMRRRLAITHRLMSTWLFDSGDKTGALQSSLKAIELLESVARDSPNNARAQRELGVAYNGIGDTYWYSGDITKALEAYQKALKLREQLSQTDPANVQLLRDFANSLSNVGYTLAQTGKGDEGLALYQQSMEIVEQLLQNNPSHGNTLRDAAVGYKYFADVYKYLAEQKTVNLQQRIDYYQQARRVMQRSRELFIKMSELGVLNEVDKGNIDQLDKDIQELSAAIDKLKSR
ncbi:MAG: protein kinase [Acidobacteriota bacterium]